MKSKSFGLAFVVSIGLLTSAKARSDQMFDLKNQVEMFDFRYRLNDTSQKLVNDEGRGFEALYGVRNFRVVLNGVYYRGGANNTRNRDLVRKNSNPLQKNGLLSLCKEGFSEAVYLYTTNFRSAPKSIRCTDRNGRINTLTYSQISALQGANEHKQLEKIRDHITGKTPGPIYDHCWNGWHASGYIAALSLRQFCGYSSAQADAYWVKNTDGNWRGNESIRSKIKNFKPFENLKITSSERSLICPKK